MEKEQRSSLLAMALSLLVTSNGLQPNSDGLHLIAMFRQW